MSVTYPVEPTQPYGDRIEAPRADLTHDEPFVPVYARRGKARGGQGKIKTWMILTPVAVLALGGLGAMMLMQGSEETTAPLAEPALTAPVLSAAPTEAAVAPLISASNADINLALPNDRTAFDVRSRVEFATIQLRLAGGRVEDVNVPRRVAREHGSIANDRRTPSESAELFFPSKFAGFGVQSDQEPTPNAGVVRGRVVDRLLIFAHCAGR